MPTGLSLCNSMIESKLSGCGAAGSARGSGLRGRRFKSDHPDHIDLLFKIYMPQSSSLIIQILFYIGLGAIIFVILSALNNILHKNGQLNKLSGLKYHYIARRHIMTKREEMFFRVLCEIFESKCWIIPQVHLSKLLDHKIKGQNWQGAFSHINGKSVDFVLLRKSNLSVLCAVELDDQTHQLHKRQERDSEVERVFREARIPLVRIRNSETMSKQDIADHFAKAMKEVDATPVVLQKSPTERRPSY